MYATIYPNAIVIKITLKSRRETGNIMPEFQIGSLYRWPEFQDKKKEDTNNRRGEGAIFTARYGSQYPSHCRIAHNFIPFHFCSFL